VQAASTSAGDDDPFARAAVSYRGEDPAKGQRIQAKAKACVRNASKLRVLVIINSEGFLVARPQALGAPDPRAASTISAIERCAPFLEAATPGSPRSYEINLG
jgi:hypothetical protein